MALGFAGHAGLRLELGAEGSAIGREGTVWWRTGDEAWPPGTSHVHLWLHGAAADVHDYHGGVPGGFARAAATIDRARAAGVRVTVSTLLTRSSAPVLAAMPTWLRARAVVGWRVAVPRVRGELRRAPGPVQVRGVGALDGLLPRLSVALPQALHALSLAARLGLPAGVGGAPHCLLGPFAGVALHEPPRAFAAVCDGCPARAACPGVEHGYLRRFAGDELSPRGLRAPVRAPPPAWMFPGPGTLEQVATDMSEEPARPVRLPVLPGGG